MTTLGEILDQLSEPSDLYQILVESGNVTLIAKLDQKTDGANSDPCAAALRAVHDFTRKADAEAWVKLIGRVQDSPSPAGACLSEMINWSLAR